jgi:hypothetical protein
MGQESVKLNVNKQDYMLVQIIVRRAKGLGVIHDVLSTEMDLCATHANGNPMDFEKLASADDFNLAHDVCGIARHLDRNTGKLENYFSPRCSRSDIPSKSNASKLRLVK